MLRGVTADLQQRRVALIHRRLLNMQRDGSLSRRKSGGAAVDCPKRRFLSDYRDSGRHEADYEFLGQFRVVRSFRNNLQRECRSHVPAPY